MGHILGQKGFLYAEAAEKEGQLASQAKLVIEPQPSQV
jgi:hypothetical protein